MIKIKDNIIRFFKNLQMKQIIYAVIMAALLVIILVLGVVRDYISGKQYDQMVGKRWSGDTRCGQVSMFFAESQGVSADTINEYVYKINKGLIADGLQEADASTEGGDAVWDYCYSAVGSIEIGKDQKTVTAVAIGVGGDFFQFHPMRILSGNYFSGNTIMKDYVILDEELAWQLFGSTDIVGEEVTLGGISHVIAGVVKKDSGKYVKATGMVFPTVFTSFQSLGTYGKIDAAVLSTDSSLGQLEVSNSEDDEEEKGSSDVNTDAKGISCMEVVMPNKVDNYAANFVKEKLSLNTTQIEVVDNTARFEDKNLLTLIQKFNIRGMQIKPVIYPYWENSARAYENILAVIFLIQIICQIILFVMAAIIVIQAYRHRKWTVGQIVEKVADWKYNLESNMKYHNEKWKYF